MAHVLLSEIIDIITTQYDEEPDSYVYGVSRTLVISHAKRVLQELSYAGMRSLRVAISEVYASGKVELPDDYVEYVKVYYCVGNYLIPAFWNPHINTAQWEGLKDFEEVVIQTETGRTIYTESGDYLAVKVRSGKRVKDYGDFHCNCFLKGYKYDTKNNCLIFDYIPEGVTHVAIEYVADPLISEPNPDNLGVHKFFQKAIEAGVYLRLIEARRNVPMNEKIRAKREWNIKYKDAVKELNAKPWEYIQVIMGWQHMRKCNFSGMGGQHIPLNIVEKADYSGRYDGFICQKMDVAEYLARYDGFICQKCINNDPKPVEKKSIVRITTNGSKVSFVVGKREDIDIDIDWGDGSQEKNVFDHTYTDNLDEHQIIFYGESDALGAFECINCGITALDVSRNTALKTLGCGQNSLTALDVSQNLLLEFLDCSDNQIASLDVSRNIALLGIHCWQNNLAVLDVHSNTALNTLSCEYNNITALDVSQNLLLEFLDCSDNQIASLDVSRNTALKTLDCGQNSLTALDVSQNLLLEFLDCSNNQIPELDVSQNVSLENLNCINNQIPELDVSQNVSLENLNCINNQITALDVSRNTALKTLGCGQNNLTTLDVSQNLLLEFLDCSDNQIASLDVSRNTELNRINCEGTPLSSNEPALVSLANSLPRREVGDGATFIIHDAISASWIQSICDMKNWKIS